MRVLILGYFGYCNNQLDGQTIKTRNIQELLQLKLSQENKIDIFDTQIFKHSKFSFLNMLWKVFRCNKLVYLPAENNLKFLFPIIFVLCWLRGSEILYFVVGGWLVEFLESRRLHVALLSNVRAILAESTDLGNSLSIHYHFNNVITFPNFRIHSFTPTFVQNKAIFRIVFMARVNKMKGLDYIFRLAEYLENEYTYKRPIIIDFYGPIEKQDEEYFRKQLNKYKITSYRGVLQPEEIYKTLTNYDIMVFPTKYYTEGFPGSVLDAYISGLPIVATHWKHATDFIIQDKTGYIVPFKNSEKDFIDSVIKIYQDNDLLLDMKHYAYEISKNYSTTNIWKIIERHFIV
jgi:glycosyltransferase involved in cell wall biosynthesis